MSSSGKRLRFPALGVVGAALLGAACSSPGGGPAAALEQFRTAASAVVERPEPASRAGPAQLSEARPGQAREFRLEAREGNQELRPGLSVPVWAFNGQVPGPEVRAQEGEPVRIVFTNWLPVESAIHWHGLHVPNAMDGVPHVTQQPVKPGETFVYEFEARPAGSHIYHVHSHGDDARQLHMGLAGPFIVESAAPAEIDREYKRFLRVHQVLVGNVRPPGARPKQADSGRS